MKNIYLTLTIIFTTILILKAQSPIIDIEDYRFGESVENAYYKDVNNFFDAFEGTWLYTNGNTSFKIVIAKRTMSYTGKFYKDSLKGEYQYIENGEEKINTLDNTEITTCGFFGSKLLKNIHLPYCEDCPSNERRVSLLIRDPERELSGRFVLKLITVRGQEALEGRVYNTGPIIYDEDNPPQHTSMNVPSGTYTFIKQ